MRIARTLLLAILIAAAFFYLTTMRHSWSDSAWISRPDRVEITQAAVPYASNDAEEQNNIDVYKRVLPSVVNITSTAVAFDFFYGAVPQEGQGSGFIIDKEGHILTNFHVIRGARQIEVTLSDRKKYPAQVVGASEPHDLAVIQIKAPGVVPAVLGDSGKLLVGQKVYAIGNPFGLHGSMTRGIISSIRPVGNGNVAIDDAIQTDAAINPGNSGGPLLNLRGEVIGINTLILSQVGQSSGVGFAIPINAAKAVLNDLITLGRVRRPALGVRGLLPIGPELAQQMGLASDYGLLIQQVVPGGPAAVAGLRGGNQRAYLGNTAILVGGDLIVAVDGQEIQDNSDLARIMNSRRAGDTVTVTVYRGKQKMDVKVTMAEAGELANRT